MSGVGFTVSGENGGIRFGVKINDKEIGHAKIDISEVKIDPTDYGVTVGNVQIVGLEWTISSWFVDSEYSHKGIGTLLLHKALEYAYASEGHKKPTKVGYTWNGENQYVMDWLEKMFGAKCTCPLAVQKYEVEYTWEAHIYELDVNKVLKFMGVE